MSRDERFDGSEWSVPSELSGLAELPRFEPPAALDQLVLSRCTGELAVQRARIASEAEAPLVSSVPVPVAERCVYGVGLALYGTQALGLVARAVWRALAG